VAATHEIAAASISCDDPCLALAGCFFGFDFGVLYRCVPEGPCRVACNPSERPNLFAERIVGVIGDKDVAFGELNRILSAPNASSIYLAASGVLIKLAVEGVHHKLIVGCVLNESVAGGHSGHLRRGPGLEGERRAPVLNSLQSTPVIPGAIKTRFISQEADASVERNFHARRGPRRAPTRACGRQLVSTSLTRRHRRR